MTPNAKQVRDHAVDRQEVVRLTAVVVPLSNGLVAHFDLALRQQILNVSKPQPESVVEPHRVADDLGGITVASIARQLVSRRGKLPEVYWS
jgi:hypothetical protein